MRLVVALFILAMLASAGTVVGLSSWDSGHHRDSTLRAIHYDTKYDLSTQRRVRIPAE